MRNIFISITTVTFLCFLSAVIGGAAALLAVKTGFAGFSPPSLSGYEGLIQLLIIFIVICICAAFAAVWLNKKTSLSIKKFEASVRKTFETKNPAFCSSSDESLRMLTDFMRSSLTSIFEESKTGEARAAFFKRITDSIPIGIYTKNIKNSHKFSIWNEAMASMFGIPSSEALGRTEEELREEFPRLPVFRTTDKDAEVMKSFVITKELEVHTNKGNLILSVTGIPLFDENGDVETILGIVENKTSSKKLEKELTAKTAQLEELNRNLEQAVKGETEKRRKNEHLLFEQSKFTAMGQMINAIAHQWRQPINALGLYIQDFEDSFENGEMNMEYVRSMTETCMHLIVYLSKTIDDFRNFYATHEAKVRFNAAELVIESLGMITAKAEYANIELTIRINGTEPLPLPGYIKTGDSITTDFETDGFPTEFKQVLLNIYHNAVEAVIENRKTGRAPRTGTVETSVSCDRENVFIEIKDNGGGIPEDIMSDIFDPYFTTKEQGKGSGVGLYMCRTVVETNMNGQITARNEDSGAVFTIILPR
ncbi:PAS domain-containing sensor histidine kinase [Geovibrio thiophilus]|uniref:histidine kinase n=1 Tax=Geovibrio thiophilus TaxID=139438 RepID=A0A3R5UY76_9BACT|nr:ATP-binding protein [Geovibrio thiophilus]QAR33389.1 PAS domain-containing sensor histidine kinase [Geovibrio thiophilus]